MRPRDRRDLGLESMRRGDCQPSHQRVLLPIRPVIFKEEPLPDASLRGFPSASGPHFGSDMDFSPPRPPYPSYPHEDPAYETPYLSEGFSYGTPPLYPQTGPPPSYRPGPRMFPETGGIPQVAPAHLQSHSFPGPSLVTPMEDGAPPFPWGCRSLLQPPSGLHYLHPHHLKAPSLPRAVFTPHLLRVTVR